MVQLRGKRNRKVPLILKEELVSAMELLLQQRKDSGIRATNHFFFANGNEGHLNSWQVS